MVQTSHQQPSCWSVCMSMRGTLRAAEDHATTAADRTPCTELQADHRGTRQEPGGGAEVSQGCGMSAAGLHTQTEAGASEV